MADAPVTSLDVARYILRKVGPMTTMKLQKLVYYAQAWSLAWDDRPLFQDPIEAWENGPVVRSLFDRHRGQRWIRDLGPGPEPVLDALPRETIEGVVERYGALSPEVLSELTHAEDPWRNARRQGGAAPIIPQEAIQLYYRGVLMDVLAEGRSEPADDAEGHLFWLKTLLSQVDPATRHAEWDTGAARGREVW
ncbi:MAG: DUF4065 domain-containing protein [Thermaerobacter sp.]|nr:DUF4065 domain-containing protein [Thermaerobacter sp.]